MLFNSYVFIFLFLQYDNVRLYSFMNEKDIITNLDNYKDYTHYSEKINTYIAETIKKEKNLITKDNVDKYFEDVYEFLAYYDYNGIFN